MHPDCEQPISVSVISGVSGLARVSSASKQEDFKITTNHTQGTSIHLGYNLIRAVPIGVLQAGILALKRGKRHSRNRGSTVYSDSGSIVPPEARSAVVFRVKTRAQEREKDFKFSKRGARADRCPNR